MDKAELDASKVNFEEADEETKALVDEINSEEADEESDEEEKTEEEKETEEAPEEEESDEEKPPKPKEEEKEEAEPEPGPKPEEKPKKYIPLHQYLDEKKGWGTEKATLLGQIEQLTQANNSKKTEATQDALDQKIKEFSETHGFSEESVRDMVKIFGSNNGLSEADRKKLDKIDEIEQERIAGEQERLYSDDFSKSLLPAIKKDFPNASDDAIAKVKEIIKKDAFTLTQIDNLEYFYNAHSKEIQKILATDPKKKSLEGSRPGGRTTIKKDASQVSNDEARDIIENGSDEDFDALSEELEKGSPSRLSITYKGKRIK